MIVDQISNERVDKFISESGLSIMDILKELNLDKASYDDNIIYAAGSIVEGLGTSTSDLDLFCILKNNVSEQSGIYKLIQGTKGVIRIELSYINERRILEVIKKIQTVINESVIDPNSFARMSYSEYTLIHRLRNSVAISNHEKYKYLKSLATTTQLERCMANHSMIYAASWKLDLQGFLDCKEYESASLVLFDYLGSLIDIILFTLGDTNTAYKFRYIRLKRMEDEIKDLKVPGGKLPYPLSSWYLNKLLCKSDDSLFTRIKEVSRFQNQVIPWCQLHFYDK